MSHIPKLIEVPSWDSVLNDPNKTMELSPAAARLVLALLAARLPILIVAATKEETGQTEIAAPSHLINVETVMQQYNVTRAWVYRHKKQLPYSQPSRKVLLFDPVKLAKWFANQKHS